MDNSVKYNFKWKGLGDISLGKPNRGAQLQVFGETGELS
jgi:hypothetical protein